MKKKMRSRLTEMDMRIDRIWDEINSLRGEFFTGHPRRKSQWD